MIKLLKKIWQKLKNNKGDNLFPEKDYIIEITEVKISCKRPNGLIEEVTWKELKKVEIHTTDQGPFVEDVFWVLYGNERDCIIPQGATNNEELLSRLQDLPDFNNKMLIEAMSCTDNNEFLIWQKM